MSRQRKSRTRIAYLTDIRALGARAASAVAVGDTFVGAHGEAVAAGYARDRDEFSAFVNGYLDELRHVDLMFDAEHRVARIFVVRRVAEILVE